MFEEWYSVELSVEREQPASKGIVLFWTVINLVDLSISDVAREFNSQCFVMQREQPAASRCGGSTHSNTE